MSALRFGDPGGLIGIAFKIGLQIALNEIGIDERQFEFRQMLIVERAFAGTIGSGEHDKKRLIVPHIADKLHLYFR